MTTDRQSHSLHQNTTAATVNNGTTLQLSHAIYSSIVTHCRAELPNEACGLLVGRGSAFLVERSIPIPNKHPQPLHSFAFDPIAWTSALYELERLGQQIVGYYHSHPGTPPVPSSDDAAGLHSPDSALMLILSLADSSPIAQAYRLDRSSLDSGRLFAEVTLKVM